MAKEEIKERVETGLSNRLQPWQAIFSVFMWALGVYGISDDRALILYGMILATLGFTMLTNYKHKEAVKKVIAPWLVEQLLKILGEYLPKTVPPSEMPPEELIPEIDKAQVKRELQAAIKALEEEMKE